MPVRLGAAGVALLGLWILGGCRSEAQRPTFPSVQTVIVGSARFAPGIDVISRIQSTSNVVMRPETDGRVVRILAREGQRVKAGQPILVLDNVQQAATLDASRAAAIKDRANAERSRAVLEMIT
ncbi:MAG: biotin/lipoyl-binding protein [Cyanobium sp.]